MRATQEIVRRSVKVKSFIFLRQPVDVKKWTQTRIFEWLSKWAEREGITTSQIANPVMEALAGEYRRLILANVAMEAIYQAEEIKADAIVKVAAAIDKIECRIHKAWTTLGVFPIVRTDQKRPEAVSGKVMNFSRPSTTA